MTGVVLKVDGDFEPINRYLIELERRLEHAEPMFDEIGGYLVSSTQGRMSRGVQPSGQPQKPVQRGGTPLVDQGILRGSLTHDASHDQVVYGTNVVYAAIHQFGGTIKNTQGDAMITIDARPYIGISDEDEQEIVDIVADWLEAA